MKASSHARNSFIPTLLLAVVASYCNASDSLAECPRAEVEAHVLRQARTYWAQSQAHEYFGFVYRKEGVIASAVVRSRECVSDQRCTLNTASAARQVPAGAKILGEWHTHPHKGSNTLSTEDVRGAYNNRHIRCYAAYYAKPDGHVHAWDPRKSSVPTAMNSRVLVGDLAGQPGPATLSAHAGQPPESPPRPADPPSS